MIAAVAVVAQSVSAVVAIRTLRSLSQAALRSAHANTPQELVYLEREAAHTDKIMKSREDPTYPIGI